MCAIYYDLRYIYIYFFKLYLAKVGRLKFALVSICQNLRHFWRPVLTTKS